MERERRVEGIYFGLAVCARVTMGLSLTVRQHLVRHGGAVAAMARTVYACTMQRRLGC
jgi:hypothetical protein